VRAAGIRPLIVTTDVYVQLNTDQTGSLAPPEGSSSSCFVSWAKSGDWREQVSLVGGLTTQVTGSMRLVDHLPDLRLDWAIGRLQ
jgi:hypothetical protein